MATKPKYPPGQLQGKLSVPTIVIEQDRYIPLNFDTKEELEAYIDNPKNRGELHVGQVFHVLDDSTPDFWWNGRNLNIFKTEMQGATIEFLDGSLPSEEDASASKLYILRESGEMFRWDTAQGKYLRVGSSAKSYVHHQRAADSRWSIVHDLNRCPSVTVVDSGNNVVVGDVRYLDNNSLVIEFSAVFSGKAYLN